MYHKLESARNRLNWHGFDKAHAGSSMGNVNPDATISELVGDIDTILKGDNGIHYNSKNANWTAFAKDSLQPGPLLNDLILTRNSEFKKNRGNTLPHSHRDLEVNKRLAESLCNSNEFFWIRQGSIPLDPETPPHQLPNFGDISTEPTLPKNEPVSESYVRRFVSEYVVGGLKTHKNYKLTKYRKAFATIDGDVIHFGGPKKLSPRGHREYPQWLIYVLCKLERKSNS